MESSCSSVVCPLSGCGHPEFYVLFSFLWIFSIVLSDWERPALFAVDVLWLLAMFKLLISNVFSFMDVAVMHSLTEHVIGCNMQTILPPFWCFDVQNYIEIIISYPKQFKQCNLYLSL